MDHLIEISVDNVRDTWQIKLLSIIRVVSMIELFVSKFYLNVLKIFKQVGYS